MDSLKTMALLIFEFADKIERRFEVAYIIIREPRTNQAKFDHAQAEEAGSTAENAPSQFAFGSAP
jgi:hypothetical protein